MLSRIEIERALEFAERFLDSHRATVQLVYPTTTLPRAGTLARCRSTVHSQSLSATDLMKTPTANFAIKYKSKETEKTLNGNVACELSEQLYGAAVWWVLLDKI